MISDNIKKIFQEPTVLFIVILCIGVLLRLLMFSGYIGGDDIAYIARAAAMSQGDLSAPVTHWGSRTLIVLLTTLSISVFGVNDFSITFFPFIFSIGSIILSYLIGKQLFDPVTGVFAAFLIAIFPMEVLFASQLFPYAFIGTLSALCFYLFLRGEQRESYILLLFSGAALGVAYLSRITALYCLLFFAFYLLYKRQFFVRYIYFVIGLLGIILIEITYYYLLTGDPLHRLHILMGVRGEISEAQVESRLGITNLGLKWFIEPFLRPIFEQEIGFIFLLLWPVIFYQAFYQASKKNKGVILLLLWIVPLFLYINYGSTSPFSYFPHRRLPRYLSVIIVPAMVLIAWHFRSMKSSRWRNILLSLILVSSTLSLLIDNSPNITNIEKDIAAYIKENPDDNYLISQPLSFGVFYFLGFEEIQRLGIYVSPGDGKGWVPRVVPNVLLYEKLPNDCRIKIITKMSYINKDYSNGNFRILQRFEEEKNLYNWIKKIMLSSNLISLVRDSRAVGGLSSQESNAVVLKRDGKECS